MAKALPSFPSSIGACPSTLAAPWTCQLPANLHQWLGLPPWALGSRTHSDRSWTHELCRQLQSSIGYWSLPYLVRTLQGKNYSGPSGNEAALNGWIILIAISAISSVPNILRFIVWRCFLSATTVSWMSDLDSFPFCPGQHRVISLPNTWDNEMGWMIVDFDVLSSFDSLPCLLCLW